MAETSFARQILAALESRTAKLSSDHTVDPRTYPAMSSYTIARPKTLPQKRKRPADPSASTTTSTTSPTTDKAITVTLKPLRGSPLTLPNQPITSTTIYTLKTAYATHATLPDPSSIKILHERRAQADSRTLAEILASSNPEMEGAEILFHVIVSKTSAAGGGAGATAAAGTSSPPSPAVAPGVSAGREVVETDAFWDDLKGFLLQRVRDEEEAVRLVRLFRGAWEAESGVS